jgi:hypothetical protein
MILKGEVVKYADCKSVDEVQKVVICDLLDEGDAQLEENAYFFYTGTAKDSPFTLTQANIDKIKE